MLPSLFNSFIDFCIFDILRQGYVQHQFVCLRTYKENVHVLLPVLFQSPHFVLFKAGCLSNLTPDNVQTERQVFDEVLGQHF